MITKITADDIRDLYDANLRFEASGGAPSGHNDQLGPVLALRDGQVQVMPELTAVAQRARILYTGDQLDSWLDGTELRNGEAETIAAEATADLTNP
jgi:hypothetical protein